MTTDDRCPAPSIDTPSPPDAAAELALYRLIVENVADVIVRVDADFRRTYASPGMRDLLGFEVAELIGRSGYELVHPDDRGRVQATIGKLGRSHPLLTMVFRMRRKDGAYLWMEARYRYVPEDGGVLSVLRDITARKHAEDALAEANEKLADANLALQALVNRDGLTGLANRRCFDDQLAEEFRRAARQQLPLALVLLDVDGFKLFNDRYGHLAGDDCLRRICGAVEGVLRRPGDLAARYGGEEIAVLLPATDDRGAVLIAELIRSTVGGLGIAHLDSANGMVTISAGASFMIPGGDDEPAGLIQAADRALYQAKQAGRNRVHVAPPIRVAG